MPNLTRSTKYDLRRDVRYPVSFDASLDVAGERMMVEMRDISCQGCLLRGSTLPPMGSSVRIRTAGLDVEARVMWREAGSVGLRFRTSINPLAVVRDNLPRARPSRDGSASKA